MKRKASVAALDPLIAAEEKEIARLEKLLGIKGRDARKKLGKEFALYEGLGGDFGDFLEKLDDVGKKSNVFSTGSDGDSDDDGNHPDEVVARAHIVDDDEQEESDVENGEGDGDAADDDDDDDDDDEEENNDDEEEDDDDDEEEDDDGDDDEEEEGDGAATAETYRPVQGEDIYGRNTSNAYVPPAARRKLQLTSTIDEVTVPLPTLPANSPRVDDASTLVT
jgi:hypothetical protein